MTGTADITSGDGGCVFEDDEEYNCDNFSGNIDQNQYAYWKGTLISRDDDDDDDDRRNLKSRRGKYEYKIALVSGTGVRVEVYVLDQEDGDLTFAGELEEAYDYYDDDR